MSDSTRSWNEFTRFITIHIVIPASDRGGHSRGRNPNRVGFGHIAFADDDVAATRDRVRAAGGTAVGTIEIMSIAGEGAIAWTCVRDQEDNIVEFQRREPKSSCDVKPL